MRACSSSGDAPGIQWARVILGMPELRTDHAPVTSPDRIFPWTHHVRAGNYTGLGHRIAPRLTTLETTQGQIDGFCSQFPFKCCLLEISSVGYWLKICTWVACRVVSNVQRVEVVGRIFIGSNDFETLKQEPPWRHEPTKRHPSLLISC